MNVIETENLNYSYPASDTPILKDISLQIEQGDFLAVIGNNGCGKSTFCKTLNGLIPHFIAGDYHGRVAVGGIILWRRMWELWPARPGMFIRILRIRLYGLRFWTMLLCMS